MIERGWHDLLGTDLLEPDAAPTLLPVTAEPAVGEPAVGEPAVGEPAAGEPLADRRSRRAARQTRQTRQARQTRPARLLLRRLLASILLGCVVLLMAGQVAMAATGFQPLVIRSGSMTPTLSAGDIVLSRAVAPTSVRAGDIVTFHRPDGGAGLITHRVMMATPVAGSVRFETRGDANSVSENWTVASSGTIGLDVLHVPRAGWLVHWLQSAWVRIGVIVSAGGWLGMVLLRKIWAES